MQFMKCFFPFSSLVISLILLSCKKDKVVENIPPCETTIIQNFSFDTVFPSNYLMAFPGSWWEYSDGQIDSCSSWVPVSIVHTATLGNCLTIFEDKKYLPHADFGYVSFDSKVYSYSATQTTKFERYYDTLVGLFVNEHYTGGSGENAYSKVNTREVIERMDSLIVNGTTYYDVIHVHVYNSTYYFHISGGPYGSADYYYAKNVGVVRKSNSSQGGPYITKDLVNHYIAPH